MLKGGVRNPGGLIVYIRDNIKKRVKEIPAMVKEVIWIGLKDKTNSDAELYMCFIYNAPQNSRWYNPNFTLELKEKVNLMRDLYPMTEILITGDMNSRTGNKQVNVPHAWDPYGEAEKMDYDLYNSRFNKEKCCNLEGKKHRFLWQTSLSYFEW
jgi:hypothetical protein